MRDAELLERVKPSAMVVVSRNSPKDIQFRELHVYVDGRHITNLKYGEKVEVPVEIGVHSLKVTNTVFSRVLQFEAQPWETISFVGGNRASGCFALLLVVFGVGPPSVFLETLQASS
jgi:hypothetical protein